MATSCFRRFARRAAWRVFEQAPDLIIVTTETVIAEVEQYLPDFASRYHIETEILQMAIELLPVERYSEGAYSSHMTQAKRYLEARDPDDVHLAALALKLGVPIWSNDHDLRELPIDVYPTAKLLKILGI